ncbi:MAG: PilZ domain-containing protein [Planctomycetota bacterium]
MDEQRNFKRLGFYCHVEVLTPDKLIIGELIDVSLNGALVATDEPIEKWISSGDPCILRLHMAENELLLVFNAKLVHYFEQRSGYEFTNVNVDSMSELRRILELNFADADLIEREFKALIKD